MLKGLGTKIDNMLTYKVQGTFKCSNCGRTVQGASIPKGESIKKFLAETPCKNCGMHTMRKVDGKKNK